MLSDANLLIYILFNWLFLLIFVCSTYKATKMRNMLTLLPETTSLLFLWATMITFQNLWKIFEEYSACTHQNSHSFKYSYYTIIGRDVLSMLTTTLYFVCSSWRERWHLMQLEDRSDEETLNDFSLVLRSIVPHSYFKQYLAREKRDMLPYLEVAENYYKYQMLSEQCDPVHKIRIQNIVKQNEELFVNDDWIEFSQGSFDIARTSIEHEEVKLLDIFERAFGELLDIYCAEFRNGIYFKKLRQKLFENMIEYEFALHATLI